MACVRMTSLGMIETARILQIEKGHTVAQDIIDHAPGSLGGVGGCIAIDVGVACAPPEGTHEANVQALIDYSQTLLDKPPLERLAIAGAFIVAEMERIQHEAEQGKLASFD